MSLLCAVSSERSGPTRHGGYTLGLLLSPLIRLLWIFWVFALYYLQYNALSRRPPTKPDDSSESSSAILPAHQAIGSFGLGKTQSGNFNHRPPSVHSIHRSIVRFWVAYSPYRRGAGSSSWRDCYKQLNSAIHTYVRSTEYGVPETDILWYYTVLKKIPSTADAVKDMVYPSLHIHTYRHCQYRNHNHGIQRTYIGGRSAGLGSGHSR